MVNTFIAIKFGYPGTMTPLQMRLCYYTYKTSHTKPLWDEENTIRLSMRLVIRLTYFFFNKLRRDGSPLHGFKSQHDQNKR